MVIKVGDVMASKSYGVFQVLSRTPGRIEVRFLETGFTTVATKGAVRAGLVKDPLVPNIFGIGFYGDGRHSNFVDKQISAKALEYWNTMFKRCYCPKVQASHPSYIGCAVSSEWHDFQNFLNFFIDFECKASGWELDKDLLVKGNKVYGPDTCVFIPREINGLLKTNSSRRGELPIGVAVYKPTGKFQARCRDASGKQITVGFYDTPEEAFDAYKLFKEKVVIEKATFWRYKLCPSAYQALMNFTVSLED